MAFVNFLWLTMTNNPTLSLWVWIVATILAILGSLMASENDIVSYGREGTSEYFRSKMRARTMGRWANVMGIIAVSAFVTYLLPSPVEYQRFKNSLPSNSTPDPSQPELETKTANTPGKANAPRSANQAHG